MSRPNNTQTTGPLSYTPIYKSARASRSGNYWEVYSIKIDRTVKLYSDLERDHWLLIEADPDIVEFCEQPCLASALIDGRVRLSIPDMWIRYRSGAEELREVKYRKDLAEGNGERPHQLKIQSEWAKRNDLAYRVVTDVEIRENVIKLNNISKMIRARRSEYDATGSGGGKNSSGQISELLMLAGGSLKFGELFHKLKASGHPDPAPSLYSAILVGDLDASIENSLLSMGTMVSLRTKTHVCHA